VSFSRQATPSYATTEGRVALPVDHSRRDFLRMFVPLSAGHSITSLLTRLAQSARMVSHSTADVRAVQDLARTIVPTRTALCARGRHPGNAATNPLPRRNTWRGNSLYVIDTRRVRAFICSLVDVSPPSLHFTKTKVDGTSFSFPFMFLSLLRASFSHSFAYSHIHTCTRSLSFSPSLSLSPLLVVCCVRASLFSPSLSLSLFPVLVLISCHKTPTTSEIWIRQFFSCTCKRYSRLPLKLASEKRRATPKINCPNLVRFARFDPNLCRKPRVYHAGRTNTHFS